MMSFTDKLRSIWWRLRKRPTLNLPCRPDKDDSGIWPPPHSPEKSPSGTVPSMGSPLEIINHLRVSAGLSALQENASLIEAARSQATWMAFSGEVSHAGPSGQSTIKERLKGVGYVFQTAAENVAGGQRIWPEVFDAWLHSAGHKQNIYGKFEECGFAEVLSAQGVAYWCLVLAKSSEITKEEEAEFIALERQSSRRASQFRNCVTCHCVRRGNPIRA